jgi:hypothetical protein
MKKLGKKELEIVVNEISKEIGKIKKEKLVIDFESSEEGKRMRELESSIKEVLVGVNEELMELRELKEKFSNEKLGGRGFRLLDLEEEKSVNFRSGFGVRVKIGEEYNSNYGSVFSGIRNDVERELILEGLKGEFDLNEVMKRMIEKFS